MTDSLRVRAKVLAVHDSGGLSLELLDAGACRGCRCGRLGGRKAREMHLELGTLPLLHAGDELTIGMPAREVLRAATWLHGLPWAGLLAGAAAGGLAGFGDLSCLAGAAAGFVVAVLFLRRTRQRWSGYARSVVHATHHP